MASEGPLYDSAGTNDASVGTEAWANTSNIGADDGSNATITLASAEQSNYLVANSFGFAVSGTIDGITVEVQRRVTNALHDCRDHVVKIGILADTPSGDNKAVTGTPYTTTATTVTYGGASTLWGFTPTDSEINSNDFAVYFSCKDADTGSSVQVDFIRVTVTYTASSGAVIAERRTVAVWRLIPEPELVW